MKRVAANTAARNDTKALRRENARLKGLTSRLQREVAELRLMGQAVKRLNQNLEMEEALTQILTALRTALGLDRVILGLVRADRRREDFKIALGVEKPCPGGWSLQEDEPFWSQLTEAQAPVVLSPAGEVQWPECLAEVFPASFLKVPLLVRGRLLGSIMCDRFRRPLNRREREVLTTFADYAALAIQNGRLHYDVIISEDELRQAQQKLVESGRMALLGQMAVSIRHEVNNPLCNISLIVQTITEQLGDRADTARLLEDLQSNVDRIQEVTRKISDLREAPLTEYLPNQLMVDLR